jgi:uncharacterized NAD-dependent epimerase/dehydratase family protein
MRRGTALRRYRGCSGRRGGVQPDDAVHVVGTDCVVGDATKMRNLVAVLAGLGIAEETGEDVELGTGVEETLLQYVDIGVALLR